MTQRVCDKTTRDLATAELGQRMKAPGFNEHVVVDLMLMAHAAGVVEGQNSYEEVNQR